MFARAGWLFRPQFPQDYGIDAQVEIANGNQATGGLIGIQIKSGRSYFLEQTDRSIVFRSDDKHVRYWLGHLLPVIVVLYDNQADSLYWQVVSDDTISSTGKGWRIDIPKANELSLTSLPELMALTQPPPYTQRLNKLRLDRAWIDLVANGETVYVEFEDWINKSLPRFAITIGCDTRDDIESQQWPTIYGAGLSYGELLSHLMPWADFTMDEDAFEQFMEDKWKTECYMGHDSDTGEEYYYKTFEEYYEAPNGIVPVSENSETEGYRLIVSLNELGRAFVMVDDHLSEKDNLNGRTFTING